VEIPAAYWPPDRLLTERLKEREFGTDGQTLYSVFCAACHGQEGEGRRFGELGQAFPAIASADFLAVAWDSFIRKTLETGRPGRRMPAWGAMESGLRRPEVEAIIRWLRSREPAPPSFEEVFSAKPDGELGRRIYAAQCATCHGAKGEGAIGLPLRGPDFRARMTDRALYETIVEGRPGTAMGRYRDLDAKTLASLIAYVRTLASSDAPGQPPLVGDPARGALLYARSCAGCHGERGEGKEAPALANRAFLAAASDGYIAATIVRGRRGTAMPRFQGDEPGFARLSPQEVMDVTSFVRGFEKPEAP
jgi:mono/diheme cytochrome c family protein